MQAREGGIHRWKVIFEVPRLLMIESLIGFNHLLELGGKNKSFTWLPEINSITEKHVNEPYRRLKIKY